MKVTLSINLGREVFFLYSFLITLREGLEAALIIGIILAYLHKTGNTRQAGPVWWGTAAALVATGAVWGMVSLTATRLSPVALEVFEGSAMFLAAAVLTYMIFWMKKQAINIKAHLHADVDRALRRGSSLALALLSFVAIIREGIETVLFLQAGLTMVASPGAYWLGASAGLAAAVALGYLAYTGTARLPLHTFFNVTSVLLIAFAAGMIANGLKEFHEVRLIPPVVRSVWDTYAILPDSSTLGRFLGALFGYDASPSLVQVVSYFAYLIGTLSLYFRPVVPPQRTHRAHRAA